MRVLIISYFFPPYNTIGAIRVGKTAKYLTKLGHDVRVISAKNQNLSGPIPATLTLEIPENRAAYTDWLNIAELISAIRTKLFRRKPVSGSLKNGHIGWLPYSYRAAESVIKQWKPDLIYASAMPSVSLIAASLLAKRFRIPWVAELRDLWVDNHYIQYEGKRLKIETLLERMTLSSASGIVTVSQPLADILVQKYNKETKVILNGYDPEDYPPKIPDDSPARLPLTITYTGTISGGRRDPSPLFQALQLLGPSAENIRVLFYGPDVELIQQEVGKYQLEKIVVNQPPISHKEALQVQQDADILLLLFWNDPREKGVFTGKLFEYIGARRPILAIGAGDNVAARLINERKLGAVLTKPEEIAQQLVKWVDQKQHSYIPDNPVEMTNGFSRYEQSLLLEKFLVEITAKSRNRVRFS